MKQLKKNILWNTIGNTAYNGLQWLITVFVTAKFGFYQAGILSIAMSVTLIFRSIAYFGVRNYQVTDTSGRFSDSDHFSFRAITCAVSFILCIFFAVINRYDTITLTSVILYMVYRLSEGFADFLHGIMQKAERLDLAGICLFIKAVTTTVCFVAGYIIWQELCVGLALMSASSVIVLLLIEFPTAARISGRMHFTLINCKKLAADTLPMFVYMTKAAFIYNAAKYFLSAYLDETAVGVYSSVFSLALIIQTLFQYIYVPYITKFTVLENSCDKSAAIKLAVKMVVIFAALALIFSCISASCGSAVLTFIFGENEYYNEIILPILFSVFGYSLLTFISIIAVIKRALKVLVLGYSVGTLCYILFAGAAVLQFGINGVSYMMLLSSVITLIIILCFLGAHKK